MNDADAYRRFFAEEIEAVARIRTSALVEAFAAVPRDRFLPPGPWTVAADAEYAVGAVTNTPAALRATPDADPRRVHHNISVAIDPGRRLFNGQPGTIAVWLDALALAPGMRVLHVGAGLGYYTAIMATSVGPAGSVTAYEVDTALASAAAANLGSYPHVRVCNGDAAGLDGGPFDATLINAGVTHPLDAWLDALAVGGRMIVPLTSSMAAMGSTIGKGLVFVITREADASFGARLAGFVAIYSAVGVRDEYAGALLTQAMQKGPAQWAAVKRLRRDPHDPSSSCWFHGTGFCFGV